MNDPDHQPILAGFAEVINSRDWHRLGNFVTEDALWEYPQSGERFRGLRNIRGQFENYPGLGAGTSELKEVIGGTRFALTPMYTLVAVDGSGDRGTAIIRIQYADGSRWWAINVYQLRAGKIAHSRSFFAPEFEPPEWRAPYREIDENA